jgi:CBS domain-containing protein
MLRVHDIMTPNVVTLSADATLRTAVDTLVTYHIGGAPVIERDRVVGVLSAQDILEFESVTPIEPSADEREDENALEPPEAWDETTDAPVSFFADLWPHDGPTVFERFASSRGPEWDFLADHTVAEAMTSSVCTVPAGLDVSGAARRMVAAGVHRALVFAEGKCVGILTTTDILRAVAEARVDVRQFAFR